MTASNPPEEWLALSSIERDTLHAINQDGPQSQSELFQTIGGVDGRQGRPTIHRGIQKLLNKGLVSEEPRDGATNEYSLTGQGERVLARGREWLTDE